jgi:hypothetical protein
MIAHLENASPEVLQGFYQDLAGAEAFLMQEQSGCTLDMNKRYAQWDNIVTYLLQVYRESGWSVGFAFHWLIESEEQLHLFRKLQKEIAQVLKKRR